MIVSLTRYMTRLALRVKSLVHLDQTTDWQKLQLVISPMPPRRGCHVGGSPWYLTGCWPFHPTGVDLANPTLPDFPAIVMDAFDADAEGRIVFLLSPRVHELPNGRYLGTLRMQEHTTPINFPQPVQETRGWLGAAATYNEDRYRTPCDLPLVQVVPAQPACELLSFDIDLGPQCAQHMVDQVVVDIARTDCGDSGEFCETC